MKESKTQKNSFTIALKFMLITFIKQLFSYVYKKRDNYSHVTYGQVILAAPLSRATVVCTFYYYCKFQGVVMNEQNPNNPLDPEASTTHGESVLEETMSEFDPKHNEESHVTIENEIDLSIFEARIAELESEVKQAKEGTARANAEAYNAQKRMEQETDKSKKFALQKFAKELLEVVDNLERAVENADSDNPIVEGVMLTHKALLAVLNKHGVEVVDPQGDKFNADFHEAVGIDPNAEADTVGTVLQKGYSLNGRLLRPAMVQVGQ